jgi:hypothetical protein
METWHRLSASPMLRALHAGAPATDRAAQMMLYGQFVGSWEGRLRYVDGNGVQKDAPAEVHFDWVLEGRAVQDVWIVPARSAMAPGTAQLIYGTTLRVYDPREDVWHITWIDPVRQVCNRMTGRAAGDDILQEYRTEQGGRVQWMFTEITPASFHWIAREETEAGAEWRVRGEFFLHRVGLSGARSEALRQQR